MKESTKWIITFSGYWSNSYVYGIGNIVKEFHNDGYYVLWINSTPNRNPSVKRAGSKKKFIINIIKKTSHHLTPLKKSLPRFYVYTPFYLPFPESKSIYRFNLTLLKVQLKVLLMVFNIKNGFKVISSTLVDIQYLFKRKQYSKYIQYVADLYSDYREVGESTKLLLREKENRLFNYSDLILVSSIRVVDKISKFIANKDKINYFPHGVEFAHFNQAYKEKNKYIHLLPFKKPIAGYFGSLTMANDKDVIRKLCKIGFSVVLIGEIKGDYSDLLSIENIHFIGEVPYNKLPFYACNFDIAFMAWNDSEWIKNSNPKKTYEYLALGLPIVSKEICQLKNELSDLIYFANSVDDFGEMSIKALKENSDELVNKRLLRAFKNDWSSKYSFLKIKLDE